MSRLLFELTDQQCRELSAVRDHDPHPYRRERAAALLKVAAGASANQVARTGLLKPRQQRTVAAWMQRYQAEGLAGLVARPRGHRGFSPSAGRVRPGVGAT